MELKEAKLIINQALELATQKGAFSLTDLKVIIEALEKINSMDDIEFIENETS